jgi:hypothetical protein
VRALRVRAEKASAQASEKEAAVAKLLEATETHEAAAKQLVQTCEGAYSAATTVGLAASFSERANKLGWSMAVWVAILMVALGIAGTLGFLRLQSLQQLITAKTDPTFVWLNFGMSLFTVAAPVWLAWISTKQISQRFRLAEDYAFKASVARAYEGYRREAARPRVVTAAIVDP